MEWREVNIDQKSLSFYHLILEREDGFITIYVTKPQRFRTKNGKNHVISFEIQVRKYNRLVGNETEDIISYSCRSYEEMEDLLEKVKEEYGNIYLHFEDFEEMDEEFDNV